MSSYDDIIPLDLLQWSYVTVMNWIESCKGAHQMDAAKNLVELFKKKYPKEHTLSQHLYRMYWKLRREFIVNN